MNVNGISLIVWLLCEMTRRDDRQTMRERERERERERQEEEEKNERRSSETYNR